MERPPPIAAHDHPGCSAGGFRLRRAAPESAAASRAARRAITRAAQGDRDGLQELYVRYADNVYSYVATIVRDHHEAEDVTQHVFSKLPLALSHYEDRGAPFLSWLLRLARNAALDELRSRRAIPVPDPIDGSVAPSGADRDRLAALRTALGALPAPQREILILRHLAGLAPHEIAARMGRSESAVHGLHHRGRRALRAELRRQGAAPATRAQRLAN
jgi:RNA polymerase sigma-70 factor (ECF subfamily)